MNIFTWTLFPLYLLLCLAVTASYSDRDFMSLLERKKSKKEEKEKTFLAKISVWWEIDEWQTSFVFFFLYFYCSFLFLSLFTDERNQFMNFKCKCHKCFIWISYQKKIYISRRGKNKKREAKVKWWIKILFHLSATCINLTNKKKKKKK